MSYREYNRILKLIVHTTGSHSPTPLKRGIENPSCEEGGEGVSYREYNRIH